MARDFPIAGIYFFTSRPIKSRLVQAFDLGEDATTAKRSLNFLSGGLAMTLATVFSHPVDVIKTRVQTKELRHIAENLHLPQQQISKPVHTGAWTVSKELVKTEGAGMLFAGLWPRVARMAPGGALTWFLYSEYQTLITAYTAAEN
jgi:hypothetical protein